MKIKVDIISGFLGAGKTTLIKKFVTEGLKDEKIFVLENEFGKVGIDGTILRESNIRVKELSSGCICCSPLLDFMNTIAVEADEFRPSRIIVEPTGVALLSEVITQFKDKNYKDLIELNIIATVVDAKKYDLYLKLRPEFFENQIRASKIILLSKVDSIEESRLIEVIEAVRVINSRASIIYDKWDEIDAEELISAMEKDDEDFLSFNIKSSPGLKKKSVRYIDSTEDAFKTFEFEPQKCFSKEELINLLERLKSTDEYGTILRGKGIVKNKNGGRYKFDYVAGDIKIEEFSSETEARVCFIGIDLRVEALEKLISNN